jgi:ribosomal protein S27AE
MQQEIKWEKLLHGDPYRRCDHCGRWSAAAVMLAGDVGRYYCGRYCADVWADGGQL